MATPSHAQAVKSLNKSAGRRRFVFKTFSQRIEEIEIDVFRSLDKVKSEPAEGSSFLCDCLIEWRELNTAEDFISFYEEVIPFVQTLPLVLLHKELILEKLLSRLQMAARLSLEPILRLITALSRDLQKDFICFLPKIAHSFVSLLERGADREPEIIEQIFVSWSYILMYLQKHLVQRIVYVLKVTKELRYYPKGYVQDFMAAATSFLLRNAPEEQHLQRGIRQIMFEVVKEPSLMRKSGVSALLYYVMRGNSSRFHSKAVRVLEQLTENSIFTLGDKFDQGYETVVEVVIASFQRLCEELEQSELELMWHCVYRKIDDCVTNECLPHLNRLLSVLISTVQINNGHKVSDYHPMLERVGSLIQKFVVPYNVEKWENHLSEIIDKVLQLMLCILDGLSGFNDMATVSRCSLQWAPVFKLRTSSFLTFISELLAKDSCILYEFRVNILSAMNNLIETSQEVICHLLSFCLRLQKEPPRFSLLDGISEEGLSRIRGFLQGAICFWVGVIKNIIHGSASSTDEGKLALLWVVICCYPHIMNSQEAPSSLMDLIDALDQLLMIEGEHIAGVPKRTWQSLVGAALSSYCKYGKKSELEEISKVLCLAQTYKSSSQVLSAVADYLDHVHGPVLEADKRSKIYHAEFEANKAVDAFGKFADNLCSPEKGIRVPTLRILCHYEPQGCQISTKDQPPEKKLKTEVSQTSFLDSHGSDVLQLLLLIESTDLSVSTSRKLILLISRIQMGISAGRISETLIPIVLSGIIGIFHNRFSYLWNPACECLSVLIGKHFMLVWDKFVHYFEQCQYVFQMTHDKFGGSAKVSDKANDLVERFNLFVAPASESTPCATILSSLLQSLQKIPSLAESRSRQIIPLFLKFLGYDNNVSSVGSFNSDTCKGKEWKGILKEWLNLLKLMRNPKAFYQSQFLKDVLHIRLMDENDAEIQMRVLDCLITWKDDFLLQYEQHLRNLISSKNLREELTTWSLSVESNLIEEGHRSKLVPLVICLLMPKVRTLKTLASRKHASVHHRKAVLQFIAQVDVSEIPLFFALLIRALHIIPKGADDTPNLFWTLSNSSMDDFQPWNILRHFTMENIMALSWKKRFGFLHVIEDIIGVLDESRLRPFLALLMGCVVRLLVSCTSCLDAARSSGSSVVEDHSSANEKDRPAVNLEQTITGVKQFKDLRSLCLKIFSIVLNKYDDYDFGSEFWDLFFTSVKPLIDSFKQEGSSSEKPSSLFSCFLAMSRSHYLVPLLYREKNLTPDIFSILRVTTASEAIISSVLKFIGNLLNLDNDLVDENNAVRGRILVPNLDELINSLCCLFQSDNAGKRNPFKRPMETDIGILRLLSKYIKDQLLARKFVDVLLPLLATRVKDSDVCFECLQVVRDIIPVLGNESTSKILSAVCPLLISVGLDMRLFICDLLEVLAQTDPSVVAVAKLLRELNATSASEMGGLDFDTIVCAYENIGVCFFSTVQEDHALVVLSHSVFDMSSDELILRQSAYRSLLSFVEFSASILCGEVQNYCGMDQAMLTSSGGCWTRACVQRIINKFLLKHLGNAMKAGSSVKKEWIELLREMVSKLPEVANLNSFKALCSEDPEQDFFNNIVHLQKHRRARALSRFKNIISKHNMPEVILNKVFVPLFFNMLFDVKSGKGENIRTSCVEALASISSHLEWESYYALLSRCFREMNMNLEKQKTLLRLICSILDQFHFSQTCSSQEVQEFLENILGANTTDNISRAMLHKSGSSVIVPEIQACLQKNVLPKIQKLLDCGSDKVNVNISVAALKVLKLLPGEIMDSLLPSIIHRIANHLKSRLESVRDEARLALAACLKELGLEFLKFIVGVLQATLRRGYELHVLGYSLNFILSKFLSNPVCGKLDYCLEDLLSVVENDLLGDVADEKEVERIASKMKETRKRKSFETLKMIAQSITFKSHALKLLSPVTVHLQNHLTPKMKTKLESMLNHIAAGIECNPSVDQTDLFVFIYGLVEDEINKESDQVGKSSSTETKIQPRHDINGKAISSGQVVGTKTVCSHLILVFALGLCHNHMKSVRLDKSNEQLLSMLDPFIKLLGKCLSSRYEDILSASLRCLTLLVRLPLPSLASQADKIKVTLLDIAQSSVNANSPLMESCLSLLTVLLRSTKITLSADQLHLLIQFPLFVDLERNPSFVALSLLKAIVNRKLVVPEIYDVVIRVAELMVTSQVESIRKKCSKILLQFLLDYHLSGTYLQQHLDFLLKNLGYEYSTGREAVLEMLHVIIVKFPKSFLDKHGQTIFIHLVQCLANDSDNKVRSMTGAVIKLLIGHLNPHVLDSVLDFSLSWYMDDKRRLASLGAQAIGLLVEVMNKSFRKYINCVLPVCRNILQSAVKIVTDKTQDLSDGVPFWKEAYYSLVMLEKILHHFHDLSFQKELEDVWEAISELLLHPYTWLRNISSRLVAFYFASATKGSRETLEKSLGNYFLFRPSRLFMIAISLCCQLKTQLIDDAVGNLITENLVFALCSIHSLMGSTECLDPQKFWSTLEQHEQDQFLKAFQLLDSRKGRGMFLYMISGELVQDDGDQSKNLRYLLVSSLLKKMGKIALHMEDIQMKIIFNCFGKISSQINQNDFRHFVFDMLLPLYKVCEGFAGKVIPDNLKQLALEVCESIRSTLGIQNFVQVYSEIRKNLKVKRVKRKQAEKVMAVVNPMRNAKRKLRIAAKHRAHKKRKIMTMKTGRWMHKSSG